ncbi:hypothetical protein C8Q76DRAFT_413485 [Earliella scabrosa]|nr:hypothetical protein C8Q76DRAFT_413485 [Earliella scabrosa]
MWQQEHGPITAFLSPLYAAKEASHAARSELRPQRSAGQLSPVTRNSCRPSLPTMCSLRRHGSYLVEHAPQVYGCVATVAEPISPCSFSAFATAIVNHAAPGPEEPVRLGVNSGRSTGNPLGTVKSRRSRTAWLSRRAP